MLSDAFGAKKCRGSAEEVPRSAEEVPRKCRGVPRKHIKINKTLICAKSVENIEIKQNTTKML